MFNPMALISALSVTTYSTVFQDAYPRSLLSHQHPWQIHNGTIEPRNMGDHSFPYAKKGQRQQLDLTPTVRRSLMVSGKVGKVGEGASHGGH